MGPTSIKMYDKFGLILIAPAGMPVKSSRTAGALKARNNIAQGWDRG